MNTIYEDYFCLTDKGMKEVKYPIIQIIFRGDLMVDSVIKKVRVVKYKIGELDFFDEIDLKEMLKELKPKHDDLVEISITKKNK